MIPPSIKNKKRISKEEYEKLNIEEKKKYSMQVFDEDFHPGPSDDINLSYTVYKAGLKFYKIPFYVYHHRKLDFYAHTYEDETIKAEHAKYFRKKWGLENG